MAENNDEISLKQLIATIREYWRYLLSKWIIITATILLGGGLGLLYATVKEPTYTGSLIFVLSNDSKNVGGLANIAGQFGLDISGGGNNGAFEGENIVELLKSKRIIKGALFKEIGEEKATLINVFVKEAGLLKAWEKNEYLAKALPFPNDISKVTPIQDSLIGVIHGMIVKNVIHVEKPDKKLSFYQVAVTSTNENIAIYLTKNVVEEAARLFIDTKTKTARENLSMLQGEADSLRNRLSGTIYSSSSKIDQTFNLNPALQTQRVPIQQNQIQTQVLATAYGEVVKNLEIAKITLQKETPLYQVIDEPTAPLTRVKVRKLQGIMIGGILCGLLIIFFLLGRKILKEAISSPEHQ